jgi:hypothetical protein
MHLLGNIAHLRKFVNKKNWIDIILKNTGAGKPLTLAASFQNEWLFSRPLF